MHPSRMVRSLGKTSRICGLTIPLSQSSPSRSHPSARRCSSLASSSESEEALSWTESHRFRPFSQSRVSGSRLRLGAVRPREHFDSQSASCLSAHVRPDTSPGGCPGWTGLIRHPPSVIARRSRCPSFPQRRLRPELCALPRLTCVRTRRELTALDPFLAGEAAVILTSDLVRGILDLL